MIVVVVCSMVIVHNIVVTKMGVLRAQFCAHATIITNRSISSHSDGATFVPIIDRTQTTLLTLWIWPFFDRLGIQESRVESIKDPWNKVVQKGRTGSVDLLQTLYDPFVLPC